MGTGAGLAGCIEEPRRNNTSNEEPKETPSINPSDGGVEIQEAVPTQYDSIWVDDFYAQQSVVMRGTVHKQVRNSPDTQYLLFDMHVGNANNEPSELADILREVMTVETNGSNVEALQQSYDDSVGVEDTSTLVFEVEKPFNQLQNAELVYENNDSRYFWSVQELSRMRGYVDYLRNPPTLDVTDVKVNSEDATQDSVPVSVTVSETSSNNFGRTEPFNVKIGSTALSSSPVYTFEVTSGDSVERTFDVDLFRNSGTEEILISWGYDSIRREFQH